LLLAVMLDSYVELRYKFVLFMRLNGNRMHPCLLTQRWDQ
jgi:hypothetical protein